MLNDLRQNNLRRSEYFIGHGHSGDESIFDFVKCFSPMGVPISSLFRQAVEYGVMVTLDDKYDNRVEVTVKYFRYTEDTGRVFDSNLQAIVPGRGPRKELLSAKDAILGDILTRLPGIHFDFDGLITNVERAFRTFSLPELLAASVQYGYGTGEELEDYLVNSLRVNTTLAHDIREIFLKIEL